jgi:hypothetical protein
MQSDHLFSLKRRLMFIIRTGSATSIYIESNLFLTLPINSESKFIYRNHLYRQWKNSITGPPYLSKAQTTIKAQLRTKLVICQNQWQSSVNHLTCICARRHARSHCLSTTLHVAYQPCAAVMVPGIAPIWTCSFCTQPVSGRRVHICVGTVGGTSRDSYALSIICRNWSVLLRL